jgi:ComF family protein
VIQPAFLSRIVDALLPHSCVLCGLHLDKGSVCGECRSELPWIDRACPSCAAPVPAEVPDAVPCADCQRRPPPFRCVIAPLHYRFPVDALIKDLKFRGRLHLAPALAELIVESVAAADIAPDALVPVPLHRWRHGIRGFNQAGELARAVGSCLRLPVRALVRRRRATRPQSGLGGEERRSNVRRAFRAARRCACRHALIVDDVVTTGETCRAVASALLDAGVGEVSVVAVARASRPDDLRADAPGTLV